MKFSALNECRQTISDEDIVVAMKKIPGYLDITPSDFMEIYRVAFDHALHRLKHAITAEQIMTRQVATVPEKALLAEVVRLLADHDISGMPVIRSDRTIAGVISEKDFLSKMGGGESPSFMHVISAVIGVAAWQVLGSAPWLAAAFAVATAIAAMHVTKTLHPPGGATALIAVIGSEKIHSLGFLYVLFPVLTGVVIMLIVALVVNNIAGSRKFPEFWW